MKTDVAIVIEQFNPMAGGLYPIEKNIVKYLKDEVFVIAIDPSDEVKDMVDKVVDLPGILKVVGIFNDLKRLKPRVIHINTLWGVAALATALFSRFYRVRVVLTANGFLDPWAINNSRYKKRLAYLLYGRYLFSRINPLIVNSLQESSSVDKYYHSRIEIISNGIEDYSSDKSFSSKRKRMLFLGRIHEKKGIYELVDKWNSKSWSLEIYGYGDSKRIDKLNKLLASKKDFAINFHGSVFGEDKTKVLLDHDAFILPSFGEGQPLAVLEAMSASLPVFITAECNLEGFLNMCNTSEIKISNLGQDIRRITSLGENRLKELAGLSKAYVIENHSWTKYTNSLKQIYAD